MKHIFYLVLTFFAISGGVALAEEAIHVTNYENGTTISYPVAIIYGTLEDKAATELVCENTSSEKATRAISGSVYDGRFKVLAELVPGKNNLVLKSGENTLPLELEYKKNENPTVVRIIYMTGSEGETEYQSQLENDPQNFRQKLDTAMKLMQAFTAERMHDLGFGRKTFNLELDENGDVIVHVLKGRRKTEDYYKLEDGQWYGVVYDEIKEEFPMDDARNLVIPAYSRFLPETKKMVGHTALGGGGGLALFGSGNLFTWPDSLANVVEAFQNTTRIDRRKVQDDSVGRSNFWGAASTTMGAALHEIGHTFDLPHTNEEHDIMTRGHDRLNRAFIVREYPHAHNPNYYDFRDDEIACFMPISAYPLACSRWFAENDAKSRPDTSVKLELNTDNGEMSVTAESGVFCVGCFVQDERKWFWGLPHDCADAPKTHTFSFDDVKKVAPDAKRFEFLALDIYGNRGYIQVNIH